MVNKLRIGIIGCGRIAVCKHFLHLQKPKIVLTGRFL